MSRFGGIESKLEQDLSSAYGKLNEIANELNSEAPCDNILYLVDCIATKLPPVDLMGNDSLMIEQLVGKVGSGKVNDCRLPAAVLTCILRMNKIPTALSSVITSDRTHLSCLAQLPSKYFDSRYKTDLMKINGERRLNGADYVTASFDFYPGYQNINIYLDDAVFRFAVELNSPRDLLDFDMKIAS